MKLSFITPTAYILEYQTQGDFILALSHLMDREKENEYERAIKASGLEIILDNGLFENHFPEGIDSLITKAERIGATIFFAPDSLYNKEETQRSLEHAVYIRNQRKVDIKIAAVVQADNESDYLMQYEDFCNNPDVSLIGLSILSIPRCFGSRLAMSAKKYKHDDKEITPSRIRLMEKLIELDINNKDCHLLGLGDSYRDVYYASKNCPWIISNDTSSAFWNGIQGRKINEELDVEGGKTDVKVDFNFKDASKEQLDLAQYNIKLVNEKICHK